MRGSVFRQHVVVQLLAARGINDSAGVLLTQVLEPLGDDLGVACHPESSGQMLEFFGHIFVVGACKNAGKALQVAA